MSSPMFKLKASRRKIFFALEDDAGNERQMFIQELTASEADDWNDYQDERTRQQANSVDGRGGNLKYKANLIARCVYDDSKQTKVSVEEVINWPAAAQQVLFLECLKLNGFNSEGIEAAKKLMT